MSVESKRGCMLNLVGTGLAVLALYGLASNMSWENYEANKRLQEERNSSDPYRPPKNNPNYHQEPLQPLQSLPNTRSFPITATPLPQYPTEVSPNSDSCSEYPDDISHRDEVCVNGMCGTFFGRKGWGIETSWEVRGFDQNGQSFSVDCDEVTRDAVVPDPNN